jgi:hypothetical protein
MSDIYNDTWLLITTTDHGNDHFQKLHNFNFNLRNERDLSI